MNIKATLSVCCAAIVGGIAGASLVLSEVRAQQTGISSTSFRLVDDSGRTRCEISMEDGDPACSFMTAEGTKRMIIRLVAGRPSIALTDNAGNTQLRAHVDATSVPDIELTGKKGVLRAHFGISPVSDDAALNIYGKDMACGASLSVNSNSPMFELHQYKKLLIGSVSPDQSTLKFTDADGLAKMTLGVDRLGKPLPK